MLTAKAAEQLKDTLVDAYLRSGGLDRASISEEAERVVAQHLLKKCRESQVGFRLIMAQEGELSMRIGRPKDGDDIHERDGLLLFADPSSAAVLDSYQLDYTESPAPTFVLRRRSQ